jgi:murein DD-endopeptidase MepM/ murein hydrolase activator NlpD
MVGGSNLDKPDLLFARERLIARFRRAYRHSELYKLQRWLKGKTLHWLLFMIISCITLGSLLAIHYYHFCHLYAVRLEGEEVGLVRDTGEVEHFLEDLTKKCASFYHMELYPEQEITMTWEYRPGETDDPEGTRENLRQRLSYLTDAYMVRVDGVPVAPVATASEVEQIIEQLCRTYVCENEQVELVDAEVLEEVRGEKCAVPPEQVCAPAEIAALLTPHEPAQDILVASRGAIASRSGRSIPTVHVKSVEKVTVEERIPFQTRRVTTDKMYTGESRIKTPGKEGSKEVTYRITRKNGAEVSREVLSERTTKKPKTQVVEQGCLKRFAWPVACGGRISQRFHGGHSGIDIAAPLNSSILAAESGVVIQSTWGSSQGNYIIIDHGSYYTLYLHNSKNLAFAGQRVSRGQTIARLGSTGRSTGPHLHFEIRRKVGSGWGGWYTNPAINPLQFF